MPVKVLLFGNCPQWVGKREITVPVPDSGRMLDLLSSTPGLAPVLKRREQVRVAVNEEFVGFSARVKDGDTVAFMTAFSGG